MIHQNLQVQHSERKWFTKKHPRNSLHLFFLAPWTKATEVCLCWDSVLVLFALGDFCVGLLIFFSVLRAPRRINTWSTGKKILMWFMEKEIDLIYGLTILYFESLISISLENRRSGFTLASFGGVCASWCQVSFDLLFMPNNTTWASIQMCFSRRGPGYWNIIRFSRDLKRSGKWMNDFCLLFFWWKFLKLLSLPVVVIYVWTIQFLYSWSRLFFGIIAVASSV